MKEGIFHDSERNLLNFFAAAVKAKRTTKKNELFWRDPVKVFVWTVKNQFKYINESDEVRAQKVLSNYRMKNPDTLQFLERKQRFKVKGKDVEAIKSLIGKMTAGRSVAA